MNIRKTKPEELDFLMKLYENARIFMANHGNTNQWGTTYPPEALIRADIASGCSYVCEEQGKVIATFFYSTEPDDTYRYIYDGKWLTNCPVVLFTASRQTEQSKELPRSVWNGLLINAAI